MCRARRILVVGLSFTAICTPVATAATGAAAAISPTPPMGWSSWYHFGCGIDEALYKRTARRIVSSGMAAVGYRYVNVDDCWMTHKRDASGALQPNPFEFPDGIAGLASYVHSLGLKLGLYLDAGTATCTGFPGSAGHFNQDIKSIAGWGVDYLKVDYCRARPAPALPVYKRIHAAIAATHRAMLLNVCDWGYQQPWLWAPDIAVSWRTTGDYFSYGAPRNYWKSVLKVIDYNTVLTNYAHPGAYNDPNQMLVGTRVLTIPEERAQFSVWSMLAAPLIAGGDLSSVSRSTLQILTNREVIAIDQDPAVIEGTRTINDSAHQVWMRQLGDGSRVLMVLNPQSHPATFQFDASQLGLPSAPRYLVRDVWQHRSWQTPGTILLRVGPHDVRMVRVRT